MDARQAALLSDPESKKYFAPFLGKPCTVKEAASEVGCALNTMLYRVKVFQKAGLLEVVEVRERPGRAVKVYRSTHDGYFVPFTATPFATLSERITVQGKPWFKQLMKGYARVLQMHEHAGNEIFRQDGQVYTTDRPPQMLKGTHPVLFQDAVMTLSPEVAVQTVGKLHEALGTAQTTPDGQRYLLVIGLIPLMD